MKYDEGCAGGRTESIVFTNSKKNTLTPTFTTAPAKAGICIYWLARHRYSPALFPKVLRN